MKRRRRLKKIFILPPVLLAALFIWLVAAQTASTSTAMDNPLLKAAGGESKTSGESDVLNQNGIGEPQTAESQITEMQTAEPQTMGVLSLKDVDGGASGDGSGRGDGLGGNGSLAGIMPDGGVSDKITLLFAGDIYFSSHVLNAYQRAGGISGVLDDKLRSVIGEADLFMANEEFPFSDRGTAAADKEFTFRVPPEKVSIMKEIGPDIVALANNHTLDYGIDALFDTLDTLDQAGIYRVGAGRNLEEAKALQVLDAGDKKIGFLAASRVLPVAGWAAGANHPGLLATYDSGILLKEIEAAKSACDYLVVYVHWGIERNTEPEDYQRTLGQQYIDAGADLVVGSHPHVLQGIEYYKGKPIIYSLGNFIFGSSIPKTMLLKVEIPAGALEDAEKAGNTGAPEYGQAPAHSGIVLTLIPGTSAAGYTRALEESKKPEFFQYMEGLSLGISIGQDGTVIPGQ